MCEEVNWCDLINWPQSDDDDDHHHHLNDRNAGGLGILRSIFGVVSVVVVEIQLPSLRLQKKLRPSDWLSNCLAPPSVIIESDLYGDHVKIDRSVGYSLFIDLNFFLRNTLRYSSRVLSKHLNSKSSVIPWRFVCKCDEFLVGKSCNKGTTGRNMRKFARTELWLGVDRMGGSRVWNLPDLMWVVNERRRGFGCW